MGISNTVYNCYKNVTFMRWFVVVFSRALRDQWICAKYERNEFFEGAQDKQTYLSGYKEGHLWKLGRDERKYHKRKFFLIETESILKYYNRDDVSVVVNSLWPSDAKWWHRSGSTLAQVMACCLMAISHHPNQCWPLISEVLQMAFTCEKFCSECPIFYSAYWVWKLYF